MFVTRQLTVTIVPTIEVNGCHQLFDNQHYSKYHLFVFNRVWNNMRVSKWFWWTIPYIKIP